MIRPVAIIEDRGVSQGLHEAARALVRELAGRVADRSPREVESLRTSIKTFVYAVYTPRVYVRNFKLLTAVRAGIEPSAQGLDFVLYNDTASVQPTHPKPLAVGGTAPRPEVIPIHIEEGIYPEYWQGFTAPRPAWTLHAELIGPRMHELTAEAVDNTLRKVFP